MREKFCKCSFERKKLINFSSAAEEQRLKKKTRREVTFSIIETENGEIFSYSICAGVAAIAIHENWMAFSVLAFKKAPLEAMA